MRRVLVAAILALSSPAFATTYYVDYVAGSDAAAGTSPGAAWKHSPGDARFAGAFVADTTNGDNVIFKGGVTYAATDNGTSLITIGASGGGIGKERIYQGGAGAGWGTGRAVIDLGNGYYRAFYGSATHYVIIDGVEIRNVKNANNTAGQLITRYADAAMSSAQNLTITYTGAGGNQGAVHNAAGHHWTVKNNKITTVQNWNDTCQIGTATINPPATTRSVFLATNSHDILIDNCVFEKGGDYVILLDRNVDNVAITNNNFGGDSDNTADHGWFSVAIAVAGTSTGAADNLNIAGNSFHDGWQYQGDDDYRCHAGDWIHIWGVSTLRVTGVVYDSNKFYINKTMANQFGSAMSQLNDVDGFTVKNNLFLNPRFGNGALHFAGTNNMINTSILNNTFVAWGNTSQALGGIDAANAATFTMKNNVVAHLGTGGTLVYSDADIALGAGVDNNIYYTPSGASAFQWASTNYTLAAWKALKPTVDQFSMSGNPLFTSVPDNAATASSGDYTLAAGSVAIDNGAALPTLVAKDILGVSRPQGVAWDIGAYESLSAAYPVMRPAIFRGPHWQ